MPFSTIDFSDLSQVPYESPNRIMVIILFVIGILIITQGAFAQKIHKDNMVKKETADGSIVDYRYNTSAVYSYKASMFFLGIGIGILIACVAILISKVVLLLAVIILGFVAVIFAFCCVVINQVNNIINNSDLSSINDSALYIESWALVNIGLVVGVSVLLLIWFILSGKTYTDNKKLYIGIIGSFSAIVSLSISICSLHMYYNSSEDNDYTLIIIIWILCVASSLFLLVFIGYLVNKLRNRFKETNISIDDFI